MLERAFCIIHNIKHIKKAASASAFLFAALFALLFSPTAYAASSGTVTDDGVNVRAAASTGAAVITQAAKGQAVTITGSEGGFYHVYFDGVGDGWISSQFVKTAGGQAAQPAGAGASQSSGTGTVMDANVNVRSSPSTNGGVLGKAQKGDTLKVTGTQSGWYRVVYNGAEGYIRNDFLKVSASAPAQATAVSAPPAASPAPGTGTVTGANTNIRSTPSTGGTVLGQAGKGDAFPVTGVQNGWHEISYNGGKAYIKSDYIQGAARQDAAAPGIAAADSPAMAEQQPGEGQGGVPAEQQEVIYAIVTSDTGLYLRQTPSQDAAALNTLAYGEVIDVTSVDAEWVGVKYEGLDGFVSAEYVMVNRGVKPLYEQAVEEASPLAAEIIAYGKQFLGTPYVYGGTNLNSGVDCSGFVYAVMKQYGISLNRASYDMANNGATVQRSQLQPGDLIFFDTDRNGRISHVGIYIGGKKFIHSSSSRRNWGVTISSLEEQYYDIRFVTANRVL